jgi:hypothetical protein
MKVFTALVNWLVVFSVYVVAAKFLDKKTGVLAAAVMLLCTPLFQQNAWGGYTSLLSLAFMTLCLMYLALSLKGTGNTAGAFILSFCLVLSHQLATFLAVIIIAPVLFVGVFKLRGRQAKGLIAILLGGAAAFGIYYLRPILPYLGELVSIVLFQITVYSLQIPFVNFESFMMYFGFFLFFSFTGLVVGYFELRKRQSLGFFALLTLAFLVPLLLSQSYLVGILLPYTRFVYFLMAPLAIFAAITLAYVVQTLLRVFESHRVGVRGFALKAFAIVLVVALAVVMVVRFDTVTANMSVNIDYYSSSDLSGYEVGTFVKNNFGVNDTGVTTQKPGNWLTMYSGRTILAQTHPTVDYSYNANCVLDLSYEITQPVTTLKVYDSKAVSDANFVFHNLVW